MWLAFASWVDRLFNDTFERYAMHEVTSYLLNISVPHSDVIVYENLFTKCCSYLYYTEMHFVYINNTIDFHAQVTKS